MLKLVEQEHSQEVELTVEQVAAIEKANPCFRERHLESFLPGVLLCHDTFKVDHFKAVAKVYLQSTVNTCGSYGLSHRHAGKQRDIDELLEHYNT